MKKNLETFFPQFRLTIAVTLIATLIGLVGLLTIPKEEDPKLLNRNGVIKVIFPGATPEKIESWVASPLETRLLSVSSIKNIETKIRPEVAIIGIELKPSIKDADRAWNDIQRELDDEKVNFPAGVTDSELERDVLELEAILFSVTHPDLVKLSEESFRLKHLLEKLPGVKEVKIHGDPEIGINVSVNPKKLSQAGLQIPQLIEQIKSKNLSIPAGALADDKRLIQLSTANSLDNATEVAQIPVLFSNLKSLPISAIASIEKAAAPKPNSIVRYQQKRSMVLGIIPETPIDILSWGRELEKQLKNWQGLYPETQTEIFAFQPQRSKARIQELTSSLLVGMASVIIILGFWMGWRTGVVVAVSVPVISVIGFGIYYLGGGVLHQISMAALLLSLGQFIDNVTVVAESTQRKIDEGLPAPQAAQASAQQFRLPMIFATGTAIAAFLPLLAAEGPTSEFTSSIPLIAVITLLVSYFFSLQATPVLCAMVLRTSKKRESKAFLPGLWAMLQKPRFVILATLGLVLVSVLSFGLIPKQFFPGADRNEFRVTLILPEGSSIFQTEVIARKVENYLSSHPRITSVASFIGQSTPHFYYSLITEERIPNRADFLIHTTDQMHNSQVINDIVKNVTLPPGVNLIPKILSQGPPTEAGVELELFHPDYNLLVARAQKFVRDHSEYATNNLRTTAPLPIETAEIKLNEKRGAEQGFDRNALALQLISWSQGLELTSYYEEGEKFPIRLIQQTSSKELSDLNQLIALPTRYKDFSISEFIKLQSGQVPSIIERKNGKRYVRIFAELKEHQGHNTVAPLLKEKIQNDFKMQDLVINEGGQSGESETANLAIFRALPLGLLLLIGCLLYEFRSYRKLLLVMSSVGIVSLGTFPGLLIGGQAFGFTSLLGILALSGIVVNNCILIIEAIEEEKAHGLSTRDAITKALELRTRPILLTTVMTFAGLLPLALENSTLWPPMAWAMISGLLVSTFISLFTIPEAYRRIFPVLLVTGVLFSQSSRATVMTVEDIVSQIEKSDLIDAESAHVEAKEAELKAQKGVAYLPKVSASFERTMNDRNLFLGSPLGRSPYGKNSYNVGGLELRQTVLAASQFRGQTSIKEAELKAQVFQRKQVLEETKLSAVKLVLLISENDELIKTLNELEQNLTKQKEESIRLQFQGRTDPSDVTKVEVELMQNTRTLESLKTLRLNLINQLKPLVQNLTEVETISLSELPGASIKAKSVTNELWSLSALGEKAQALSAAEATYKDSYLPQIDVVGRYQNTEQGFLVDNTSWYSLGIQLRWSLFDGGENYQTARAKAQERRSVVSQKSFLAAQRESAIASLEDDLKRLADDIGSYRETTSRVTKVLKQERMFYASGKVSLNQVLETERLLIKQKSQLIEASFNRVMVALDLWHLEGREINEQTIKERVTGGRGNP